MSIFSDFGERVAFNEGYQKQKISEARSAGADAFSLGQDRVEARSLYFTQREILEAEAAQFLADAQIRDNLASTGTLTGDPLEAPISDSDFDSMIEEKENRKAQEFDEMVSLSWDEANDMNADLDNLTASETLGMESSVALDSIEDDFINSDPWGLLTGSSEMSDLQQSWSDTTSYSERSELLASVGRDYDTECCY